ncbi:hypothetical protein K7I13_10905 [Brucepastera parasyntrophica]|uniref:hypothetical protein n=1 Tax=Brucepastera parasyntrophica TaxID=2880008 RepID=UPI0021096715|nr:hypothetical protein [Brucepastera parasyntrophica]ULQ59018.1 hypothetical protein K7I13_10905 [Brucepastera parasyntrophica]
MKIHLLGPSGSGTSTLGKLIAGKYEVPWFDSDDLFWIKTDPPFTVKRDINERTLLLRKTLSEHDSWVLSGSALGWGDFIRECIDIAIYKYVEPGQRLERLLKRERQRYGGRIESGGDMYESSRQFIDWAMQYEKGGMDMRSAESETAWLEGLSCPVIKLERVMPAEKELDLVFSEIARLIPGRNKYGIV